MSFNGTGTFVINSSGQPVVSGTVISATVFNALTADLATGLSTCITKDGQTTPTNNIPMGGFKITGLGAGTVGGDAVRLSQLQAGTAQLLTVSGTDTLTALGTPALTAYAAGNLFYFVAAATNTTSVTLNVDGLGARSVTRHGSTALVAGDILAGEVCLVVYDGTRFQLLNPASYTNLNVTGVLSLAAGAVGTPSLSAFGDVNTGLWFPAADTIAASVGGVEGWRLTSTGNLGVGITPAAWTVRAIQLAGNPAISSINGADLSYNAFWDGAWKYVGTARALWYSQVAGSGEHRWYNAPSGTAGTAITFTQAMTLDASGNLGIGTASPAQRLHVQGNARVQNSGADSQVQLVAPTDSFSPAVYWGVSGVRDSGILGFPAGDDALVYRSGANSFSTGTERFRITAVGNVVAGGSVALATNATNGFLYVPTCAGTPTGTPTAITGMAPIVVNTTNNKLYFYSGGAWRDAGP